MPPAKDAPVMLKLPEIDNVEDLTEASKVILNGIAEGEITLNESLMLARLLGSHVKLLELSEIDRRIKALENRALA